MTYNFKSVADVEVVEKPTTSANVLIEEDGIIKRASKSAVGGGGGGLCITFNSSDWVLLHVPADLYNTIKEMYTTGVFTPVDLMMFSSDYNSVSKYIMRDMTDEGDYFHINFDGGYGAEVYPNGITEFMSYD